MKMRLIIRAALTLLLLAAPAMAQGRVAPSPAQRDSLEARVRARMEQVLRTQLGLNDEQVRRLSATNRQFEGQRRQLFEQERRVRVELRAAIELGDSTQNARIGPMLDRTMQIQRERLTLQEAEQKELATFLTPLQRAKLFGMEEQMRRRMTEMRESGNRPDGPQGGPPSVPRQQQPRTRRPPQDFR